MTTSMGQDTETHTVDISGRGAVAGLCEGDEVVSLNGEPCADLTLPESFHLMQASDSLQLLVKRCGVPQPLGPDSQRESFGEADPDVPGLESTTLEVWSPGGSSAQGGGPDPCESQDEAYYGEAESDSEPRGTPCVTLETPCRGVAGGAVVELQVSLADRSLDDGGGGGGVVTVTAVPAESDGGQDLDPGGSEAELSEAPPASPDPGEPAKQRGDPVTSSSSSLGQVELTLPHPAKGREGEERAEEEEEERGVEGRVLGDPPEEGGSPARVSFGVSAEGAESPEEWDSGSERDLGRPSKHRARHARLRRSESQSEKQVKEAKSKCKRIALLLTATPNPTNKGVLMFKKRRQRAKKFTLVSYGTGETEPEDEEEDYEEGEDDRAVELTLLATSESEFSEDLPTTQGRGDISGHDWDATLLEVEQKVDTQGDMEHLPGTKGKGALMFAQRRLRIDEIAAEHEEMRRKGIPVEGVPAEAQDVSVTKSPQIEEHSTQASVTQTNQAFQDVNTQQLQHQQYQDHQQQQHVQTQQYPQAMNGTAHLQANDPPRSLVPNRSAKPFSGVQNRVPMPFSPSRSVASLPLPSYSEKFRVVPLPVPVNTRSQVWSPTGELIASRDERISVPAIKIGILQDTRKRGTTKYTVTSKVSPHAQLSIRADKRGVFESGPEEDFLSLGAEACNFMQTPTVRSKDPPPVAPRPTINPASPPWATRSSPQPPLLLPQSQSPILAPGLAAMRAESQSPQQHAAVSLRSPPQAHPQPPKNTWTPPQTRAHPQPPTNAWAPSQPRTHSQPPMNAWAPQHQRAPVSTAAQTYTPPHRPTKSWNQPQVPAPSTVSRPVHFYPHSRKTLPTTAADAGSATESPERPAMRGRGAELFARRQARMEKFVVDAETVQANKGLGRSCSLSLPRRLPSMSSRSDYGSPVTTPVFQPSFGPLQRQGSWMEQGYKPPSPWEAASRNPLGLVDEAFAYRNIQETIASNVKSAAQRKSLPEPPAEWKARVSYEAAGRGNTRSEVSPAFNSLTRSVPTHYGPPFRQYQPQRSVTETGTGYTGPSSDYGRPLSQPGYRPMYSAAGRW